jgi:hypothetical protein
MMTYIAGNLAGLEVYITTLNDFDEHTAVDSDVVVGDNRPLKGFAGVFAQVLYAG